ncbi:hypothetical protein HanIR_Chr06g0269371 [Helianthus annuus]|nr:hypothetical protein HanIR_Chr06g0269371 [Helianthus annuus]
MLVNKQGVVQFALRKSLLYNKVSEPLIPSARSLLKTVKRLFQTTHMISIVAVTKSHWLIHENCLLQVPIKEGICNIQLVNRP